MKNILIILFAFCVILLQRSYYEDKIAGLKQNYDDLMACEQVLDQTQDRCDDLIIEAMEQARQEVLEQF